MSGAPKQETQKRRSSTRAVTGALTYFIGYGQ